MNMCARRMDGAGDIKVEIFRPLSITDGSVLRVRTQRRSEVTHEVRRNGSNDSSHADRCEITSEHFVISSAGLRSNFSNRMVQTENR